MSFIQIERLRCSRFTTPIDPSLESLESLESLVRFVFFVLAVYEMLANAYGEVFCCSPR